MIDYVLIAALLLAVTAALRALWRRRKRGGCCGGCYGCQRKHCPSSKKKGEPK